MNHKNKKETAVQMVNRIEEEHLAELDIYMDLGPKYMKSDLDKINSLSKADLRYIISKLVHNNRSLMYKIDQLKYDFEYLVDMVSNLKGS